MAHELSIRKDGFVEMAFTGARSAIWHKLGNQIDEGASLHEWERTAGMDWRIERDSVRFYDLARGYTEFPEQHVLYRSDTGAPLSVVSENYKVVQPSEIIHFFADLIREAGFKMTTAGVLYGGRKFWAQADVGEGDDVVRGDFVGAKLLLATACDGTMATIAKGVSERVVCANTLGFAMGETGGSIVRVSHRSVFDGDAVKRQLGVASESFARFMRQARELTKLELSPERAQAFVLELMGGRPEVGSQEDVDINSKVRASSGYNTILALFNGQGRGSDLPGVRNTAWGLLGAATEYVDHFQRARSLDNKFDSSQFGAGDALKTKVHEKLAAMLV